MIEKIALSTPGDFGITPIPGMKDGGLTTLEGIIQWGITMLLIASALLALFFLIAGGIQWASSGGDKAGLESARKKITYAIIGLAVVFLSFMLIKVIGNVFRLNLFV